MLIRLLNVLLLLMPLCSFAEKDTLLLAGTWRFKMDAANEGIAQHWFNERFTETVHLPGSMPENGKGNDITVNTQWTGSIYDSSWFFNPRMAAYRQPGNIKIPFWLTPAKHYVGAAWYQADIEVPAQWQGKHVLLYLERPHGETSVWIDDKAIGTQYGLSTPQQFDLTQQLTPGKHTLTLRQDNGIHDINVGPDSHSITDHTQGNWNGVVGNMFIKAGAATWLDDVQVYPDVINKKAVVQISVRSLHAQASGSISISAHSFNTSDMQQVPAVQATFHCSNGEAQVRMELPMGQHMLTWDEFHPALYKLDAALTGNKGEQDHTTVQFGMRSFTIKGTQFQVNGRTVHLRGTVENCIFPLTGYAPMDVASWQRVFRVCKSFGLNHMRFHSYCPPEAAFIAADLTGFYLQPEGPSWANHGSSLGDGKPIDQFIYDETNRMAKAYGNYASFCMLAYGNEPRGSHQVEYLTRFVHYWMERDNRRVYTGASVGQSWPLVPDNQYMVKAGPRGLNWNKPPESLSDYHNAIAPFNVPYVTHEMGQWCVFPNFAEISKYKGVYQAKNFELFRDDLARQGMSDEAQSFLMASGKLQVLCYKAEIEKSLRTKEAGGFQLLELNDYPGQGTALVGVLDAFWDEKGYVDAKSFSRFCNAVVPLARLPKFVFTSNETINAAIEIYQYGSSDLPQATVAWAVRDQQKKIVAQGSFAPLDLPHGQNTAVGNISLPLAAFKKAAQLNLEVTINNTAYANDWNVWVYPSALPEQPAGKDVYYCTSLDSQAIAVLNNGGKVFLNAAGKIVKGKEIIQNFTPVFWNTSWFKMRPPHTLGILCNPSHPVFNFFPTSYHSDLQWWDVLNNAQVMHLEDFPANFRPLVQPIDTWFMNRRLGLLWEARAGKGKIIVSSADLGPDVDSTRPAARQLYYSIQQYMRSSQFNPNTSIDIPVIRALFTTPSRLVFQSYSNANPDELKPKQKQKQTP